MEKIIKQSIKLNIKSAIKLDRIKRKYAKENSVPLPNNIELLDTYRKLLKNKKIKQNSNIERILKTRDVRSLSGIAVISVLTKPYPCPGRCLYCPTEKGMPKSYLSNEPAVMRAILNKFHPYRQVKMRLRALKDTGHPTDKIELIVIGGTWSYLPKKYQTWFIKQCFIACNETLESKIKNQKSKTHIKNKKDADLKTVQKINETAKHRIVGLTLETRPDFINKEEIKRMRMLGATRVELGAQSLYDDVLYYNHRGHAVKDLVRATKLLRDAGFKICYHMMPNLPKSSISKDKKMFKKLFNDPDFRPDMLKIYPCVVLKEAKLYELWKTEKYKSYTDKQLFSLMAEIKKDIPYYVRINRLIRDIPAPSITAGNKISNLRQLLKDKGIECKCIRCREAGHILPSLRGGTLARRDDEAIPQYNNEIASVATLPRNDDIELFRQNYDASDGKEIFLSFESPDRKILYAFLRLRIPQIGKKHWIKELQNSAIIRELHTYGQLIEISKNKSSDVQHRGLGKKLMAEAEKIVKEYAQENPAFFSKERGKIAIISGIGVREYYKKLGYKLDRTYMTKLI